MKKSIFLRVVKEILNEAWLGLIIEQSKPKQIIKKNPEEAYEKTPVVYQLRPLMPGKNNR